MDQLRVGIVGCGEVTQIIHLPTLNQLSERFGVTALCDVSDHVLQSVGDRWGIAERFSDEDELLGRADVDVVLVANPDAYHATTALAAIAAGKHVLIEKPMCMTLRDADEIIEAQARSGRTVQVGYMRRYAPAFLEARELVGEIGPIRLARVHDVLGQNALIIGNTSVVARGDDVAASVVEAGKERRAELLREAIGEASPDVQQAYNLMLGLSSHDLSAMRELLGRPRKVLHAAQRGGGTYLVAAFDYGDYVCQFETGVDDIPRFDAHLEIYGRDQVIRVQYDTPYVRNLPIRVRTTGANGRGGVVERSEHPMWGDPFVAEWEAFYSHVVDGTIPKSSPSDFREDLELFEQMVSFMR